MSKAIIAITSYYDTFYPDGKKTGLFVPEAIHPFEVFRAHGLEVDIVSETGTYGIDDNSLKEDFLFGDTANIYNNKHSEFNIALKNIKTPREVNAKDYKLFYAAGGHGTLYDFPTAKGVQEIAQVIWSNGGVVSALCHGPAIFTGIVDTKTGRPLIEGKTITGFTEEGESIFDVEQKMKDENLVTIPALAKKLGAKYVPPPTPLEDFSLADGKLVTGVNPKSATSTALKAVQALDS